MLLGVGQPGAIRAALAARLIPEAEIAGLLGRVALRVGVANDRLEAPAERLGSLAQPLLGAVQVAAAVVGADALQDRVEVAVEFGAVDALQAVLGPLLTDPRAGCAGSWSS